MTKDAQRFVGIWREDKDQYTGRGTLNRDAPVDALPPTPVPPPPGYDVQEISLSNNVLKIVMGDPRGMNSIFNLRLDGSEVKDFGDQANRRIARSHIEDGKITTDWRFLREGQPGWEGRDIRSLSEDGDTLVVDRVVKMPDGTMNIHSVFRRQR